MPLPAEMAAYVENLARVSIAGGYDSADSIVEGLVELVEYDPETKDVFGADREGIVQWIRDTVDARMAEHAEAERSYPPVTDCDRLSAAFAQLSADGIIAREDVGSTPSDLREEMWSLFERALSEGSAPRGWAAFHRQDVERVVDSGELFIGFASVTDDDRAAIGAQVVDALIAAGLTPRWTGDPNRRIELTDLHWEKRRRRPRTRRTGVQSPPALDP